MKRARISLSIRRRIRVPRLCAAARSPAGSAYVAALAPAEGARITRIPLHSVRRAIEERRGHLLSSGGNELICVNSIAQEEVEP